MRAITPFKVIEVGTSRKPICDFQSGMMTGHASTVYFQCLTFTMVLLHSICQSSSVAVTTPAFGPVCVSTSSFYVLSFL